MERGEIAVVGRARILPFPSSATVGVGRIDTGEVKRSVAIGHGVPFPDRDDVVRIGSGNRYLEFGPDGKATMVGATGDDAVQAVLDGLRCVPSVTALWAGGES